MHTHLVCSGCGAVVDAAEHYPFRCPNAATDDGVEHCLQRVLAPAALPFRFSQPLSPSDNPFVRYRERLHSYQRARDAGLSDDAFVRMVEKLDDAVFAVDARRFTVSPCAPQPKLAQQLGFVGGTLWLKNETGNVSGSHKARHLFGILLHLQWLEEAGLVTAATARESRLAIASCGNAALAAAVVAKAAGRALDVFIPPEADPLVVARLEALGAKLGICQRCEGQAGDPCYLRFKGAVAEAALPFTCQGPDNGLTLEGGQCIAYELAEQLGGNPLDDVIIQVGGAALATAVGRGLLELAHGGALAKLPRFHTLQTRSAFPLARAYERLAERIAARLDGVAARELQAGHEDPERLAQLAEPSALAPRAERAERIRLAWPSAAVQGEVAAAARDRAKFMWPWEDAPHSVAHGILDDETYDWLAVVSTMLETGGIPVVANEDELRAAHALARNATDIPVCPTGSAGLAGMLLLRQHGIVAADARVALLFTGIDRAVEAAARAHE